MSLGLARLLGRCHHGSGLGKHYEDFEGGRLALRSMKHRVLYLGEINDSQELAWRK
jgi:hypothetical protein